VLSCLVCGYKYKLDISMFVVDVRYNGKYNGAPPPKDTVLRDLVPTACLETVAVRPRGDGRT
jgi:hypothetical protein